MLHQKEEQANKEKEIGNEFFKNKKFKEALDHYEKAIQLDPNNLVHLLNRGFAHLKLENYKQCIQDCDDFLTNWKDRMNKTLFAKALYRMGIAYSEIGNFEDAKWCFKYSCAYQYNPQVSQEASELLSREKIDLEDLFHRQICRINYVQDERSLIGNIPSYDVLEDIKSSELEKRGTENPFKILFCGNGDGRNALFLFMCRMRDVVTETAFEIHINDIYIGNLARNLVLYQIAFNFVDIFVKNGAGNGMDHPDVIEMVCLFISIWGNFRISKTQRKQLNEILKELINGLESNPNEYLWFQIPDSNISNQIKFFLKRWLNFKIDLNSYDAEIDSIQREFNNFFPQIQMLEHYGRPDLLKDILEKKDQNNQKEFIKNGYLPFSNQLKKKMKENNKIFIEELEKKEITENPTLYSPFSEECMSACGLFQAVDLGETENFMDSLILYGISVLGAFGIYRNRFSVVVWGGDCLKLNENFMKLDLKFDIVCTSNLGDYIGFGNIALTYLPLLNSKYSNSKLYTQSMLGFNNDFKKQIENEFGNTITSQEIQQIFSVEIKELEWSSTSAFSWKLKKQSKIEKKTIEKLSKTFKYLFSFSGSQNLMTQGIIEAVSRGQLFPQYSIYGFLKLIQYIDKKYPCEGFIDSLLSESILSSRKTQIMITSRILQLSKPLLKKIIKFSKDDLKRFSIPLKQKKNNLEMSRLKSSEDHLIGILLPNKESFEKASSLIRNTLHQYLDKVEKHQKIDILSYDIHTRIIDLVLPKSYEILDQEEKNCKYFVVYDFRNGVIINEPIYIVKAQNCGCCLKKGHNYKICSRCKTISYCSVDCQKKHWSEHKKVCQQK